MKRILSLVLAVVMMVCLLGTAMADEKPTLKVLFGYTGYDCNTTFYAELLEEKTGYHVEYDTLPSEDSATKLNAILFNKEPYDVISLSTEEFEATVGQGAYLPLNDLLETYGAELLAGTDASLLIGTTVDGEIMGIPFKLSKENYNSGLRIRTDLLKEAGIETVPTTPEELYTACKAVKEKLGIIPFTDSNAVIAEIAGAFGVYNVWNVAEDGSLVHMAQMEGAKEYVTFMHKMYEEGLLDSEWAQNSGSNSTEKFLNGKALMYRVYWWSEPAATENLLKNFPEATFEYLPPLAGENGSGISLSRGADKIIVIPRSSKNPEAAMDWMNSKVKDPELFKLLAIGEEGKHHVTLENGDVMPILPTFLDEWGIASDYLTGTISTAYGEYWAQTRVRKNETLFAEFCKMQENIAGATIHYDPLSFMPSDADYTDLAGAVNSYVTDTFLQMIVGTRSLDEWDAFVNEFVDMGGDSMTEIVNAWWTSNKDAILPALTK